MHTIFDKVTAGNKFIFLVHLTHSQLDFSCKKVTFEQKWRMHAIFDKVTRLWIRFLFCYASRRLYMFRTRTFYKQPCTSIVSELQGPAYVRQDTVLYNWKITKNCDSINYNYAFDAWFYCCVIPIHWIGKCWFHIFFLS